MILFAFEVDTLEIALKEQMDVLDKIFIVESTVTHKGVGMSFLTALRYSQIIISSDAKTSHVGEIKIHQKI